MSSFCKETETINTIYRWVSVRQTLLQCFLALTHRYIRWDSLIEKKHKPSLAISKVRSPIQLYDKRRISLIWISEACKIYARIRALKINCCVNATTSVSSMRIARHEYEIKFKVWYIWYIRYVIILTLSHRKWGFICTLKKCINHDRNWSHCK